MQGVAPAPWDFNPSVRPDTTKRISPPGTLTRTQSAVLGNVGTTQFIGTCDEIAPTSTLAPEAASAIESGNASL